MLKTIVPITVKIFIALGLLISLVIIILAVSNIVFTLIALPLGILAYYVFKLSQSCPTCGEAVCSDFGFWHPLWLFLVPFSCPHCGEDLTESDFVE